MTARATALGPAPPEAADASLLLCAVLVVLAVLLWPRRTSWRADVRAPVGATRRGAQDAHVPEVLDLLALALHGGTDVRSAVHHVAVAVGGTPGRELQAVAAALAWGLEEDTAWQQAPPRWVPAHRALALAAQAGVPPAALLRDAAADLRRDAAAAVEVATSRLAVRLVLPLGLAFLPAFILTTVVPVVAALAQGLVSPP